MARKINPLARFREDRLAKREEARRKRERERRRALLICGALIVLLIPVFIVGIVNGRREAAKTAAASAAKAPTETPVPSSPAPAKSKPTPAPEPSATKDDDDDDEPVEYDENHLQFGQTGHFTSTLAAAFQPEVPLEFTVSSPTPFELSKDADLSDASPYSGRTNGVRQPSNVFFTLTVKNLSKSVSYGETPNADVTKTGDDDTVSYVDDGDIEGLWRLNGGRDLRPGKSATVKLGFSVKSAEEIQFELHFDGLHGDSYYFTK